jgi:drug/metabolite transporter superfamily protein YnfA
VTIVVLVLAAAAEVVGDLGMRHGLAGRPWGYALGVLLLAAYGLIVNQPALAFGRLLGLYIAVFFVVSQLVALITLGERPPASLLLGGAFIVAGGLILHFSGVRS